MIESVCEASAAVLASKAILGNECMKWLVRTSETWHPLAAVVSRTDSARGSVCVARRGGDSNYRDDLMNLFKRHDRRNELGAWKDGRAKAVRQ